MQVKDLSQQVARLVHEVQVLQSGLPAEAAGGAAPGQFGGGNASDVTTQRLVEFKDIEVSRIAVSCSQKHVSAVCHLHASTQQELTPLLIRLPGPAPSLSLLARLQELQQQNARLLVVNRQLSQEAEATRADAEAALRAEYEAGLQQLSGELDGLRASRQSAEKMLQQVGGGGRGGQQERWGSIAGSWAAWATVPWVSAVTSFQPTPPPRLQVVRQRDTLRQLLQSSGNNLDFARQAYAQSAVAVGQQSPGGGTAASPLQQQQQQQTDGTAAAGAAGTPQAAGGPDYRSMYADLEAQLKEYKEEAAKTAEMLSKDVS